MKRKSLLLFTILILFFACNGIQISERLDQVDSLIVKEQYDSASVLVKDVAKAIKTDEERAHYYLLETQLGYLTNQPLESDSLLDLALNYYNKVGNEQKLADAYYYKSCRSRINQDYSQAILNCKEAERLAKNVNDDRLHFKITENLSFLNGLCGNDLLQLQYAKKALELAKKIHNKNWMAYSYNKISFAHANLGQYDSALVYIEKTIPLLNYVKNNDKATFLTNIGLLYMDNDLQKAKFFFEKALTYSEHPSSLENLANVYYDEGNQEEAYKHWKKALKISGRYDKDNIIHNIMTYNLERGNLDEASQYIDEVLAIKDSMLYQLRNDTIKDLQLRFDHEVAMHEADKKLISTQRMLIGLVILLGIMAVYILIRKRKEEAMERAHQMQLYAYITEINQLKANQEDTERAEKTIRKLNNKIRKLLDDESPKLKQGRMLYDHIMNGGTIYTWKNKEKKLFNNYYAAINYQVYNRLRNVERAYKYSEHNMFYLILKEMGKDDKEIMRIMGISPEGLRSLRSRTKPVDQNDL